MKPCKYPLNGPSVQPPGGAPTCPGKPPISLHCPRDAWLCPRWAPHKAKYGFCARTERGETGKAFHRPPPRGAPSRHRATAAMRLVACSALGTARPLTEHLRRSMTDRTHPSSAGFHWPSARFSGILGDGEFAAGVLRVRDGDTAAQRGHRRARPLRSRRRRWRKPTPTLRCNCSACCNATRVSSTSSRRHQAFQRRRYRRRRTPRSRRLPRDAARALYDPAGAGRTEGSRVTLRKVSTQARFADRQRSRQGAV